MNIAACLARAAVEFPDRCAVAAGTDTHLTYRALVGRTSELAAGLQEALGALAGDRIVIFATNQVELVELFYGCWWAGLVVVPVNAKLHPNEVLHIIRDAGAKAVFSCSRLAAEIAPLLDPGVALYVLGSVQYDALLGNRAALASTSPDDLAWLFYTSGTTGAPKGAMITHANLAAMAVAYAADVDAIEPGDALVHAAPMSHGSGLYMVPFVGAGAVQVIPSSGHFEEAELFELIGAYPRSSLFAAPTMVKRMTRWARANQPDHTHLRTVVYGGGPLYYEDLMTASAWFGNRFAQIYGQGECPMTITSMRRGAFTAAVERRDESYLRSVGMPFTCTEVTIRDADGRDVPQGEVGEVCVRSAVVCRGYWKNPEATAKTFRDGWLMTGDLGKLAPDGVLVLAGRSKEVIISGGTNIYPIEVEDVLLSHPQVVEAAVIGVPDPEWGENVVAYVVAPQAGASLAAELDALCTGKIARFKRPKVYRVIATLPKNNYGKIVKRDLLTLELARNSGQ